MISWIKFELDNSDIHNDFENMCRYLFKKTYCTEETELHSNPNHPGIEVDPVKEKDGNYISFQAKYFTGNTDYQQIIKSCKQIVKHYNNLNKVYLYCNKDVDTKSKSYIKCVEILKTIEVELIPITNQEILELVSEDAVVRDTYFSLYTLDAEWFGRQVNMSLKSLGSRFNEEFNVFTNTEKSVAIFSENKKAAKNIRKRLEITIQEIEDYYGNEEILLLDNLYTELTNFLEKDKNNLKELQSLTHNYKKNYHQELKELKRSITSLEKKSYDNLSAKERGRNYSEISSKKLVLEILQSGILSKFESSLINSKMLILTGGNGEGKTQTFANTVNNIICSGSFSILLLGNTFISDEPVEKQILQTLDISDQDFNKFLNILEGLGENKKSIITVFVDGIEETPHSNIWKVGIERIYQKLENYKYVKFAFSFRSGYENKLYSEFIKNLIENRSISHIAHEGIDNIEENGIKSFLNHYNIPFSPSYYFNQRLNNPLFLMLYCQTYDGNEMDIRQIFTKLIEKSDRESKENLNINLPINLLEGFLKEFVSILLKNNGWYIDLETLLQMKFWDLYGLSDQKLEYINLLTTSNILNDNFSSIELNYYISYTLLRDYLIAVYTYNKMNDKDTLKLDILKILNIHEENYSLNTSMINSVMYILDFYYQEYSVDLIFWLLEKVTKISTEDGQDLAAEYIRSFTWKKNKNINEHNFKQILSKYEVSVETVFYVLIDNSLKENNPINAEFLHELLYPMEISWRDFVWTTYINTLGEESRLVQIILSIESGEMRTNVFSESQNKLMLILFGWVLTSSNRFLRDKSSKAMIEILKQNFHLSLPLLKKFEGVNDPYIIQRLYGIIFGASLKRVELFKEEYSELCGYIYKTVFNSSEVYPDILLRDYARQIIERWIFENPTQNKFDRELISPPYNSKDIPEMQKKDYYKSESPESVINLLYFSMNTNQGASGDFGRYIFRSALKNFKGVDVYNCYLYAMDEIIKGFGYSEDFSRDDRGYNTFNQYNSRKIERIGKKYQWIVFYKIMAKISDNYEFLNIYEDEENQYNGPWNPYIRDFDPTVNNNFLINSNVPRILSDVNIKFLDLTGLSNEKVSEWINEKTDVFDLAKNKLLLTDNNELEWAVLFQAQNYTKKEYVVNKTDNKRQIIWRQARAYFVKKEDFHNLVNEIEDKNFDGRWFPEGFSSIYTNFNREFYWAASSTPYIKMEWKNYEVESEEFDLIEYESNELLFNILDLDDSEESKRSKINTFKRYKNKKIAKVLPSYNTYLWEDENDASQEDSISFEIPCSEIINHFKLEQKEYDGYFYDDDLLVAYDSDLVSENYGLIIRKDYLEKFLDDNNYEMLWVVIGEKQFIHSVGNQIWSEWSGLILLDDEQQIDGSIEIKEIKK